MYHVSSVSFNFMYDFVSGFKTMFMLNKCFEKISVVYRVSYYRVNM